MRSEVLLVLLATAISVLESALPRPVPFMKPGFANMVTVAAVWKYGLPTALRVNILRSVGAALLLGTLATPSFLLSLAGGVSSALAMGLLRRALSIPGISVAGSVASLWTQLLSASIMLPGLPIGTLLLPLALWGVLSGSLTGIFAVLLLRRGFPWAAEEGLDSA